MGSSRQIEGSQEKAKDLISEGIRIFEELGDQEKIAEAQSDLGVCYWREGAFSRSTKFSSGGFRAKFPLKVSILRGKILLRLVNVAISTRKYQNAIINS